MCDQSAARRRLARAGTRGRPALPVSVVHPPPVDLGIPIDDLSWLQAADVDGDGREDLLAHLGSGRVDVFWNRAATLARGPSTELAVDPRDSAYGRTAELDGDGRADLFVRARRGEPSSWRFESWLGDGSGGFAMAASVPFDADAIVVGDLRAPSRFRVELFDGRTGTMAKSIEGIEAGIHYGAPSRIQLDSVLWGTGVPFGWARVVQTAGWSPFFAYAVVNDGAAPGLGSGDGTYLPGTSSGPCSTSRARMKPRSDSRKAREPSSAAWRGASMRSLASTFGWRRPDGGTPRGGGAFLRGGKAMRKNSPQNKDFHHAWWAAVNDRGDGATTGSARGVRVRTRESLWRTGAGGEGVGSRWPGTGICLASICRGYRTGMDRRGAET